MVSIDSKFKEIDQIVTSAQLKVDVNNFLAVLKKEIPMEVGLPKSDIEIAHKVLEYLQAKLKESKDPDAVNLVKVVQMEEFDRTSFFAKFKKGQSMDQGGIEWYYYVLALSVAAGAGYYYVKHVRDNQ